MKFTEEHKRKLSIAAKKRFSDPEERKKQGYRRGGKVSEETREKISIALKGKKKSPFTKQHIENLSKSHKGKHPSEESRKKLSESTRGEKNVHWKGGLTAINLRIRHSLEYKLWRMAVFKRDNFTCIWCGAKSGNGKTVILNADHIKPFASYPELRFAIDNGRTLCVDCHKKTDTWGWNYWVNNKIWKKI